MPFNGQPPPFGVWPPPPPPNINLGNAQPWPPPPPPPGNPPPMNLQQQHNPSPSFQGGYTNSGSGGWQQAGDGRNFGNNNGWKNEPPNRGRGSFRGRGRGW
jgi:hypothetical protein